MCTYSKQAVVLPMTHKDLFIAIGIKPPKGVLLYGPPGTGKTLMARACAKKTNAVFLKLAGPQLVQMFIGDGAKMVRDAFELAKEKCKESDQGGAIIFIDELDAIGTKRFGGEQSGDREVQRTMLELLNQLDGFTVQDNIKVGEHYHPFQNNGKCWQRSYALIVCHGMRTGDCCHQSARCPGSCFATIRPSRQKD